MKCPKDGTDLVVADHQGIEVDRCETCRGLWLDYEELDMLEDKVFDQDDLKGTTVYSPRPTERECPRCQKKLIEFHYHGGRTELDMCPDNHGFWLDEGEDKEVLDFMRQRKQGLGRIASAERSWHKTRTGGSGSSLLGKIKGLLGMR